MDIRNVGDPARSLLLARVGLLQLVADLKEILRIDYTDCCGVREVHGISWCLSPKEALEKILRQHRAIYDQRPWGGLDKREETVKRATHARSEHLLMWAGQLLFFQATPREDELDGRTACSKFDKIPYGENLARYLEEQGLGPVARSTPGLNPNTGRMVQTFVWTPDLDALKKWVEDNKVFEED